MMIRRLGPQPFITSKEHPPAPGTSDEVFWQDDLENDDDWAARIRELQIELRIMRPVPLSDVIRE